jgi:hypothetical protein
MTDERSSPAPTPDSSLDELLDLAARLAPPEEPDRVWERSASGDTDRFSHMLRHVDTRTEQPAAEPPSGDGGEAVVRQPEPVWSVPSDRDETPEEDTRPEPPSRALIPVSAQTTGWRILDPLATLPRRWRRPAGIGSALAAAGLVVGVGLHTWGPDVGFTPYTPAPVTAGGSPQATYQSIPIYSPPAVSTRPPVDANPLSIVPVSSPPASRGGSSSPAPVPATVPVTVVVPVRTPNPTPAPTASPTAGPTPVPPPSPLPTPKPTRRPKPSPSVTPAPSATPTPAPSPTPSPAPSPSSTPGPTTSPAPTP